MSGSKGAAPQPDFKLSLELGQRGCIGVGQPGADWEQRLRSSGLQLVAAANIGLPGYSSKAGCRAVIGVQLTTEITSDEKADRTLRWDTAKGVLSC